jgi:hypothetical protein
MPTLLKSLLVVAQLQFPTTEILLLSYLCYLLVGYHATTHLRLILVLLRTDWLTAAKLLMALASTTILSYAYHGAHDHILTGFTSRSRLYVPPERVQGHISHIYSFRLPVCSFGADHTENISNSSSVACAYPLPRRRVH